MRSRIMRSIAVVGLLAALPSVADAASVSAQFVVTCKTRGQACSPPARQTFTIPSRARITKVTYANAGSHCSDVAASVRVDGSPVARTPFLAPGAGVVTVRADHLLRAGRHQLAVYGLGRTGGCNVSGLQSWGGSVTLTLTAPDRVVLSGNVTRWACSQGTDCQRLEAQSASGHAVSASGRSGTHETTVRRDGTFEFLVKRGRYTVRIPGSAGVAAPRSRAVQAQAGVANLNFNLCEIPTEYKGPPIKGCKLVSLDGEVVDFLGARVPKVGVILDGGNGNLVTTDAAGAFRFWVLPGTHTVSAWDGAVSGKALVTRVRATRNVKGVKALIKPNIWLDPHRDRVRVQVLGLAVAPQSYVVAVERDGPTAESLCQFRREELTFQSSGTPTVSADYFLMPGSPLLTSFCSGTWKATIALASAPDKVLDSAAQTMP